MDALRNTINTQSIKTKQIVFQYPDGSFPEAGAVLNVTDARGHTDWTRAPNLDSITLVDASGYEGVLTYTNDDSLLVNGVPVGGGGGVGTGGTNITVSGGGVIAFKPNKDANGVDMLGAKMTNADRIEMGTTAGAVDPLLLMSAPAAGGNATIRMRDGTTTSEIIHRKLTVGLSSGSQLDISADIIKVGKGDPNPTISSLPYISVFDNNGGITAQARAGPVTLSRRMAGIIPVLPPAPPAPTGTEITHLSLEGNGEIQLGAFGTSFDPKLQFQSPSVVGRKIGLNLVDASGQLVVDGSGGTSFKIAVPLIDVSSGSAPSGYVLTAAGSSAPPFWAPASGGGGSVTPGTNISVSGSTVSFDPSGGVNMLLNDISGAQSISISNGTETALLDISGANLLVSSSTAAGFKIGVPLVDVSSGTAGAAGQVLTTDGINPPFWAYPSTPFVLQSITYTTPLSTPTGININNATFSAVPSNASWVTVQITLQGGGGGGGGGLAYGSPSGGGIMTSGGGGGGGAGYSQTLSLTVQYNSPFTYTVGAGGAGGGGNQILVSGSFDAAPGATGGTTQVVTPIGTYSVVGGGGGGGGSGTGGAQAGGAGSSPGTAGSFTFSGPGNASGDDGNGCVWGGVGGGTYGGVYGDGTGGALFSPAGATYLMYGGQVNPIPPLSFPSYSGAGGGGGGGGAGSYAQNGAQGAQGYVKIDILSFY